MNEEWIKVIKAHDIQDGDLLIVDLKSGLLDHLPDNWPVDFPRVNVIFVNDVNHIKHIQLGRDRGPGPHPGKIS
jgi:hypothetical protein